MKIFESMGKAMGMVQSIGKGERNDKQGYSFRGIDTVYNELHGILVKSGIFTMPEVLEDRHEERESKAGGCLIYRVLKIKYTFYSTEDGSSVSSIVIGEGMDSGDKASNKAMSIGHKYALLQAFCIPTKEEKDPDYTTHEVVPRKMPPISNRDQNFKFLEQMKSIKKIVGDDTYYTVLGLQGFEHANQITDRKDQAKIWTELQKRKTVQ